MGGVHLGTGRAIERLGKVVGVAEHNIDTVSFRWVGVGLDQGGHRLTSADRAPVLNIR